MTAIVSFEIPGEPVGKGRPRFVRATGRAFTPGKTMTFENMVKALAAEAMAGRAPVTGPVSVHVSVHLGVAASWSVKRRAAALAGETRPTKRPDVENVAKSVLDGMNGVVFADDSQVCLLVALKCWTDRPRTEVLVNELAREAAA